VIDRANKTMDVMRSLDRRVSDLERKIESTRGKELKKAYCKTQRRHRADLERLECDAGVSFKELHRTRSFAVTRERIRQIEAKALRKLRQPSRSRRLKAFLDDAHE
jgi:hypothetical protein